MSEARISGHVIDSETLAAYIDGRLSAGDREAVEAAIAADPETYEWLVHSVRAQDEVDVKRQPVPTVLPFLSRRAVFAGVTSLLVAAAALVLVVRLQPAWWQSASPT